MDSFELKPAPLWKRVAGYFWCMWYKRVHTQRRKRDLFIYRERKRLSEPPYVMAELVILVLFSCAILAAYGFAAAHRAYFERKFNEFFNER